MVARRTRWQSGSVAETGLEPLTPVVCNVQYSHQYTETKLMDTRPRSPAVSLTVLTIVCWSPSASIVVDIMFFANLVGIDQVVFSPVRDTDINWDISNF